MSGLEQSILQCGKESITNLLLIRPTLGIVTLNKRLLAAPRGAVEYVVLHELCHLIYPDHSKQFYDFLAAMMPDWKERKQLLNNT